MEYEDACVEPILPTNKNCGIFEKICAKSKQNDDCDHIYEAETSK